MAHSYDAPVYQIGNSRYHSFIYDTLITYLSGITVLHDIYMHGFLWVQRLHVETAIGISGNLNIVMVKKEGLRHYRLLNQEFIPILICHL